MLYGPADSERKLAKGQGAMADTLVLDGAMIDCPHLTPALRTLGQAG